MSILCNRDGTRDVPDRHLYQNLALSACTWNVAAVSTFNPKANYYHPEPNKGIPSHGCIQYCAKSKRVHTRAKLARSNLSTATSSSRPVFVNS